MAEQKVGRLDIAVHQSRLVNTGQRRGRRGTDCSDLALGQRASLMQHVGERAGRPCQHEFAIVAHAVQGHDARTLHGVQPPGLRLRTLR